MDERGTRKSKRERRGMEENIKERGNKRIREESGRGVKRNKRNKRKRFMKAEVKEETKRKIR